MYVFGVGGGRLWGKGYNKNTVITSLLKWNIGDKLCLVERYVCLKVVWLSFSSWALDSYLNVVYFLAYEKKKKKAHIKPTFFSFCNYIFEDCRLSYAKL